MLVLALIKLILMEKLVKVIHLKIAIFLNISFQVALMPIARNAMLLSALHVMLPSSNIKEVA